MIKELKKIECDICGKEIKEGDFYGDIKIPCPTYSISCYMPYRTGKLSFIHRKDVCFDCLKKLSDAIESVCSKYGEYAYSKDYIVFK